MAIEEVRKNKSAKRPNFHKGSLSHSPSQTNGDAKVQINSEISIPKLQKLAETYFGVSDPHRFLTDLRVALGIPDSQGASKYGVVSIPKEDGSILQASLRVTNHQANANTYIDHDANYKYNLSIVVRRKQRKNTFIPNENVILDEYVYYGTKMQGIENPLTQIVNGIIVFLQSGEYKDTTGVAFKNQSVESKDRVPQNISVDNDGNYVSANAWGADYVSENKQYKTNTKMNKKLIRLTEQDLHKIVKESVNRVLNEVSAEKAYWLMQQRKQTPNTKAKTQMHYPSEFANRFNKEVYGTPNGGNMRIGNQVDATAYADPRTGNFVGTQATGWDSWRNGYNYVGPSGANFKYTKNTDGNEDFTYDRNDTDMDNNGKYTRIGQQMNPSQVNMHPQVRNFIGKGRARYNQIQQNYNQSQQGN